MRRKRKTTVTAFLPYSVELTKLKSGRSLEIEVRSAEELLGRLSMGRGSVQWWPRGNKTNRFRKSWAAFADMLDRYMQ